MSKLNNRLNDFVTLFNAFWYRDFPLSANYKTLGSRAEWTTHIGVCVRSCADLLGLFTYFESGVRTDAVIKDNIGNDIAHIEWEWWQASSPEVNEIKKLFKEKRRTEFSVFISYSRVDSHDRNLLSIRRQWRKSPHPLLVFLVTFERENNRRMFKNLETYLVRDGKMKHMRSQPALPWQVVGTRWELKEKTQEIAEKVIHLIANS